MATLKSKLVNEESEQIRKKLREKSKELDEKIAAIPPSHFLPQLTEFDLGI